MKRFLLLICCSAMLAGCSSKLVKKSESGEKVAPAAAAPAKEPIRAGETTAGQDRTVDKLGAYGYVVNRYVSSKRNVAVLQKMKQDGLSFKLFAFAPSDHARTCRGFYTIYGPGKRSFSHLIQVAANRELTEAGAVASKKTRISATLDEFDFSAIKTGKWTMRITLEEEDKEPLMIVREYPFPVSLWGMQSCQTVAEAVGPAIQELLYALYTHPRFPEFARYTACADCEKPAANRYRQRKRANRSSKTESVTSEWTEIPSRESD